MKRFYFVCAKGTHGGPEAIHQIVDKINTSTDYIAYVAYFQKDFVREEKFSCFNVNYIKLKDVRDSNDIVICTPETHTYFLRKFKKAQKAVVWLSLYHYLRNIKESKYSFLERCKYLYPLNRFPWPVFPIYYLRDLLQNKKHFRFEKVQYIHTYNCEYVADFLRKNGIPASKMTFLDGPIRAEYFEEMQNIKKSNIIAYNPAKGAEKYAPRVIEEIKKISPDIEFIPIAGLTVSQVKESLLKAKVYLDFGFFPGPEKLVKEAVLCGCNIITSNIGAAKNKKDILISEEFKFDMENDSYAKIAKLACDMLYNYEKYNEKFIPYADMIKSLTENFENVVKEFVELFSGEENV